MSGCEQSLLKNQTPFMLSGAYAGPILAVAVLPRDAQQCISFLQFGFLCMHPWLPIATWQLGNLVRLKVDTYLS